MTPYRTYRIAYLPEPEGGYSVIALDVNGTNSCGDTLVEARAMILDCIACMLDVEPDDVLAHALLDERVVDDDEWDALCKARIAAHQRGRS